MTLFIAIDDRGNKTSIGTGRLSRMLADELVRVGLLKDIRLTGDRLFVHLPRAG